MMKAYQEELLDAVKDAEHAAVQIRRAAVRAFLPEHREVVEYLQSDTVAAVEVTKAGYLNITLPAMMPHRKKGDQARFLSGPIHSAVEAYFKDRTRPRFDACVIVYEHIYDSDSRRRFADHDNLELKRCQDELENCFLVNDDSSLCCAFQCSHWGGRLATRIWILSPEQFRAWLDDHPECWFAAL